MTEPTEVGSIVAYLVINSKDWDKGLDEGEVKAKTFTRNVERNQPTIRITVDDATAIVKLAAVKAAEDNVGRSADKAKPFVVNLWAALAAIAPAAVPIAGVAAGIGVGLVPVLAAAALGFKGISDQAKSGQLALGPYGGDIKQLQSWFVDLKTTAASGLLVGIDQAVHGSHPLFQLVKTDIGQLSGQIGGIVGSGGPALLTLFTQLNPLFLTIGTSIENGAVHLEHWAQSSTGVKSFVAYAQTELPPVLDFLGQLVTLLSHTAQAAAPFGGVMLNDLTLFIHVLNDIPIPVLQQLVPLLVAGYVAVKAYQGSEAAMTGVNNALTSLREKAGAYAAAQQAAAATTAAAAAQESAAVLTAAATAAQARAEWAVEAAATAETVRGGAAAESQAIAEAAIEEAASYQASADAAVAAAAEKATAAESAVAASAAAGLSFTAMLGPIAAVGVGVGLLVSAFGSGGRAAQQAAQDENTYTQALTATKGVLDDSVRATVAKNLADKGALTLATQLGISLPTVTDAVVGQGNAYRTLHDQLAPLVARYNEINQAQNDGTTTKYTAAQSGQAIAAKNLNDILTKQAAVFDSSSQSQQRQAAATDAATDSANKQVEAQARLYGMIGTTGVTAYLAAVQAAQKSTQQAQAQTLQWQLENDAADLLSQAIDRLSGKNISYAQAGSAFDQSLVSMVKHTTASDAALTGMSSSAIQNRADLINMVQAAERAAEAYGTLKGSAEAGRQKLIQLEKDIIDNAKAHGEDAAAVKAYIDTILQIPASVPPTKLQIDTAEAKAKALAFAAELKVILGTIAIQASFSGSGNVRGTNSGTYIPQRAGGGQLPEGWATVGERGWEAAYTAGGKTQIFSNSDSRRMLGGHVPGFANGTSGIVTITPTVKKAKTTTKQNADSITVTTGDGSAYGIADVIRGSIPDVADVTRELAQAVNDAFQLKGIQAKLAATKADLANMIKAADALKSSVNSTLSGSVDPSKYADIGGLIGAYQNQTGVNTNFNAEIAKLSKEHLNAGLLAKLIATGPSAGLDTLAGASTSDIAQVNQAYGGYAASAAKGATTAATVEYGTQIANDRAAVTKLTAAQTRLLGSLDKLVAAIGSTTNKKVQIILNGKVLSETVINSNEFHGVIDHITHELEYAR